MFKQMGFSLGHFAIRENSFLQDLGVIKMRQSQRLSMHSGWIGINQYLNKFFDTLPASFFAGFREIVSLGLVLI